MARINMPHPFDLKVGVNETIHLRKGVNDIRDDLADHWVVKKYLIEDAPPLAPPAAEQPAETAAEQPAETAAEQPAETADEPAADEPAADEPALGTPAEQAVLKKGKK